MQAPPRRGRLLKTRRGRMEKKEGRKSAWVFFSSFIPFALGGRKGAKNLLCFLSQIDEVDTSVEQGMS